ncbi:MULTISPECIES: hypothetical protein [unclassified Guyparkeria]|uniref:hypothetical protein n=1 Tax=unclassified Guyparkeria TaxID=2626246 RepID=UPI0007338E17|nr:MULTISPECIES: hypothetical protein [unclassified Guyparkeria]KTG16715.1 hypothetical protein AUR63_01220 [Guyparkeria sp. XI15]OAE85749.1 hypothetical protein AWR35_01220 [Guyparkeria sp. WRN-7]
MMDLDRLHWRELRTLLDEARAELERREAGPVDEHTALKSLELDFKRHRRRQEERFDPFA